MKQKLLFLSTFLLCTPFLSQSISLADSVHSGNDHSMEQHSNSDHSHAILEIPAGEPIPSVDLIVHSDPMWGWNLELQVENFEFVPESVNQDSSYREGHGHLYINGEKVTRLYGNWYHIPKLSRGT
ncbi:MAG: hypothetical protein ACOC0N_12170 [Chroococcales cyanobacterium]